MVIVLVGLGLAVARRWDTRAPGITLQHTDLMLKADSPLVIDIREHGTGLRSIQVSLSQGDQVSRLASRMFSPPPWLARRPDSDEHFATTITIAPQQIKALHLKEGEVELAILASDYGWPQLSQGNQALVTQKFFIDTTPPQIALVSSQQHINRGGADMVLIRVSADTTQAGLQVGTTFFPACAEPLGPAGDIRMVFYAYPYNAEVGLLLKATASDAAGNGTSLGVPYTFHEKKFNTATLELSDTFMQAKTVAILPHTPTIKDAGDTRKNFLAINGPLRQQNNDELARLGPHSAPKRLWQGAFKQLANSQVMAGFADHRIYNYQGQPIDEQDHLGYDLASLENSPATAAHSGTVVFADYLGIYGNTVVVDHGCGLASLYAHLSLVAVQVGDAITQGQALGKTGKTGLAGGDHLHYGIMVSGMLVDPIEWWDPHWIKIHITDRIEAWSRPSQPTAKSY